jgi:tetratricopeptide (TPR) repeat protein
MDINYNSTHKEIGDSLMITLAKIKKYGETPQLKSEMLFKYGRLKYLDKDYDKAFELFGQSNSLTISESLSENKEIYYWCGRVLEAQGKIEIAKNNYEMVLKRARFLNDQIFVDEILDRIFLISTNKKEDKLNIKNLTLNERILICIEISNKYRTQKVESLYKDFISDRKLELAFKTKLKNIFLEPWNDKEWTKKTNLLIKILAAIIQVIHIPIFILISFFKEVTKKYRENLWHRKCKNFKDEISKKLILKNDKKKYNTFISLWNSKGLNIKSDEHEFYEGTVIECVILWYNVFFDDNRAEILNTKITQNTQNICKEAYDNGVRGLQMQSISSQLLEELNFDFNN